MFPFSAVACSPLPRINQGSISYEPDTVSVENNYAETTVATYTCNSGYGRNGDDERTCGNDGEWTGGAPTCEGKHNNSPCRARVEKVNM